MIPVRIKLQNFLAYRAPQPVEFTGIQLACLTGANGAGKSSLLDAVTWALWGKARTRRDNDLIHLNTTDMLVEMDFLHEGQKYRVVRRRTRRGATGSSQLDLFIYSEDGEINEIREGSQNATQDRINTLLRLDYDTFTNSAFLQQGQADAFTTQTPARRKQILANILGLEDWEVYEKRAKEKRDVLQSQIQGLQYSLEEIERELATEPQLRRNLEDARVAHEEAKQSLEVAEQLLNEVADVPNRLRTVKDHHARHQSRQAEHQRDLDDTHNDIKIQEKQIADYEAILENREEIETGYKTLTTAREASEALSHKLSQLRGIDEQIADLQTQLASERTRLQTEKRSLNKQITDLTARAESADEGELEALLAQIAGLELRNDERENVQAMLSQVGEENAELRATNTALRVTMNELKERIDTLEQVEGALCPLCGQPLTEDHRLKLLDELKAEGTTQGDTFRANITRMDEIQEEQKTLQNILEEINSEVAALPKLQKKAGELQAQTEAAQDAQRQLDNVHQQLADVTAALENETYALEVRAGLERLEAEKAEIGYDEGAHDEHREALSKFREYEAMHTRLSVADKSLPPLIESRNKLLDREQRLIKTLDEMTAELTEIEAEIAQLIVLEEEHRKRQAEAMRLRTAAQEVNNRVIVAEQALKALDAKRERKKTMEERREQFAHQHALYDELRGAFGKNGVPAMIIETAIPELETIANDLLARMTDGRMTVSFSTQREKVTGGTMETLDIAIRDELGTRNYELYSGGEAFRINFAIRVALSKMLARRAGAHLETLFIDEGFGTQDEDGRSKLIEAINAIKPDFSLILVITHIDDLKDAFPVHIHIEKTPQGSTIEVR